jgi:hypothetical protein
MHLASDLINDVKELMICLKAFRIKENEFEPSFQQTF